MKISKKSKWIAGIVTVIALCLLFVAINSPYKIQFRFHQTIEIPDSAIKKEMIGIWQDSNYVAAGWSDAYQFYQGGKFIFNYSQMDCTKREVSYTGNWDVIDGILVLRVSNKKVIEGGQIVEDVICGSAIEGGKITNITISPPENQRLDLSGLRRDDNIDRFGHAYSFMTIELDGRHYWRHNKNPSEY
jgi:hypothetical protein